MLAKKLLKPNKILLIVHYYTMKRNINSFVYTNEWSQKLG
jgi:hypothetical protein